MTALSPVTSRFQGHHDLLNLRQWTSGSGGYVKSKMYQFHPQTVSDLKDAVRNAIQEIPITIVRAAVLSTICLMQNI